MSAVRRCRECGGVLPPGGPTGLCAKCLLLLGIEEGQKTVAEESVQIPGSEAQSQAASMSGHLTEKPGDKIGPYKLLEQIGRGGFGVVYVAEQSQPVKRRVALKIIKLGMDTRQVVARFEAERQALA